MRNTILKVRINYNPDQLANDFNTKLILTDFAYR